MTLPGEPSALVAGTLRVHAGAVGGGACCNAPVQGEGRVRGAEPCTLTWPWRPSGGESTAPGESRQALATDAADDASEEAFSSPSRTTERVSSARSASVAQSDADPPTIASCARTTPAPPRQENILARPASPFKAPSFLPIGPSGTVVSSAAGEHLIYGVGTWICCARRAPRPSSGEQEARGEFVDGADSSSSEVSVLTSL